MYVHMRLCDTMCIYVPCLATHPGAFPHGSPRSHQVTREFECQAVQLKDKICPKHMVLASQQIMAVP